MTRPAILAGFEPFRVPWLGHRCTFAADGHVPERHMAAHYAIAADHGIAGVRDALPPWLDPGPRLAVAADARMPVVWDLSHWWHHEDPAAYARRIAEVAPATLTVCFNEMSVGPRMGGPSRERALFDAGIILGTLTREGIDVRLWTAEPAHQPHEVEHHAPLADYADVVGLNLYPYHIIEPIEDVLARAAERYPGKRLAITETGLDTGTHRRERPDLYPPDMGKGDWLRLVLNAVERSGVPVGAVCLYPITNSTAWDGDQRRENGLIRADLTVDADLSAAIREVTVNDTLARRGQMAAE